MKPEVPGQVDCSVEQGERLPAETGGPDALCAAIREAAAPAGESPASVRVRVLSTHAVEAQVTLGDRRLDPIQIARSDRPLGRASLERFARSIASAIAKASQK